MRFCDNEEEGKTCDRACWYTPLRGGLEPRREVSFVTWEVVRDKTGVSTGRSEGSAADNSGRDASASNEPFSASLNNHSVKVGSENGLVMVLIAQALTLPKSEPITTKLVRQCLL